MARGKPVRRSRGRWNRCWRRPGPWGRHPPIATATILLGVLILLPFTPRIARPATLALCGKLPAASAPDTTSIPPAPSAPLTPSPRLGLYVTARAFAAGDALPDVYGTIACAGLVYSRRVYPGIRMAAAAGYGRRSVDEFDDPTFVQPNAATLELLPIELGFRFGRLNPGAFDLTFGIAAEGVWLRETLPPLYGDADTGHTRHSGFVPGVRMALGPDWRLPWRDLVLGAEVSLELTAGANDDDGWYANPMAVAWRISLARTL